MSAAEALLNHSHGAAALAGRDRTSLAVRTPDAASREVTHPEVSIIIVSYNTCAVLRQCMQSVIEDSQGIETEILVVDNASSDGSAEMIAGEFPQAVLLRSPINLGFAEGNNLALRQARGRYFVLLNSDAFFVPGSLRRAIAHMDATPECGIGGGRLVGRDGSSQPSSRCFHSVLGDAIVLSGLAARFPRSKFFGRFDRTWADEREEAEVDWVPGAFSILRPSLLQRVGYFDASFFLYYEEVDLCLRCRNAGLAVWYWPDIEVIHLGGESSKQVKSAELSAQSAQVVLWRMRSTLLYYRKHHGPRVYLAKWMEQTLYRISALRNRLSLQPARRERVQRQRKLIALMERAWTETHAGRVSPPRPW